MIGTRLGPYEITAKLGEGGMGEVYRATDTRLGREVAIKVLPPELAQDEQALARFEREARAVAGLSHPNILGLHDFATEGDTVYAVMELLDGETLRAALAAGALPMRKAVEYGTQVARGLAAAHERGVVHRDLKPENIFVTRDDQVKILDFGLAKEIIQADDRTLTLKSDAPPGITERGTVLGTVGYMAPEQVRGEEADTRSDIFAFGAILYEMLGGRRAFRGDSAVETMSAILMEEPPELSETGRDLAPGLDRIVRHCLEKKPETRFQSARDIAFALESVASDSTTSGMEPLAAAHARHRRRWLTATAAGALLLIVGTAGWWLGRRRPVAHSTRGFDFERLTFRRGMPSAARFAPDGQTFVYSAAWEGNRKEIYLGRLGSPESRSLGIGNAELLSVSSRGELAVGLDWHLGVGLEGLGTLATVPLEGGAPREILHDVVAADWAPDGESMAVSRLVGGSYQLEYPIGTVLYRSDGWMSDLRVCPDGTRVAFIDHPNRADSNGFVSVVDRQGKVARLSPRETPIGVVWSPDGRQVWFGTQPGTVFAVDLAGAERRLFSLPGPEAVMDVAPNGNLLFSSISVRREVMVRTSDASTDRNLTWFDWSYPDDLSADGRTLLFEEQQLGLEDGYAIYTRDIDGSPAVRFGEGHGLSLSPDGRWLLVMTQPFSEQPRLSLIPTGAGTPRPIKEDGVRYQALGRILPDGSGFLMYGREKSQPLRLYLRRFDPPDSRGRPLTPDGVTITIFGIAVSPDSRRVAVLDANQELRVYSLADQSSVLAPGSATGEIPLQWDNHGNALFTTRSDALPMRIDRLDLTTGRRTTWASIMPSDPAGVFRIGPVRLSRDGKTIVYSFIRFSGELFLARPAERGP